MRDETQCCTSKLISDVSVRAKDGGPAARASPQSPRAPRRGIDRRWRMETGAT